MAESTPPELSEFEREQALEFSRHYDNLLWLVTSLFTTANAALMAIAVDKLTGEIGILGIGLSVATVFFATSFRLLRRRVHARLGSDEISYRWLYSGLPGWAAQWPIYVGFYIGLAALWTSLLLKHVPDHRCIWVITFVFAFVVFIALYAAARRHTPGNEGGS